MSSVVINEDGLLYGGFSEGKPVWYRTKRDETLLDDEIARKVVSQLEGLCLGKFVVRDASSIARNGSRRISPRTSTSPRRRREQQFLRSE